MTNTDRKKKLKWQLPFLAFLIIGTVYVIRNHHEMPFQKEEGMIFGTVYHMTYQCDSSLQNEIVRELQKVDGSLSPFNKESVITKVNNNDSVSLDSMFLEVFGLAKEISRNTDGAFDITVAPLVNAWGFGFKNTDSISQAAIDSILQFVGFDKIKIENGHIVKQDPRTILDCSAIAKGYGTDVVARYLEKKGIQNYMVEIGGEIAVKGTSPTRKRWKIGVNKPTEDSTNLNNEIQTILNISNIAMATSGNYRNFYYKDGKKYAHTIDPKTGYPVQHSILSSTVLAKDCATADAYATAFMVLGLEKAKQVLAKHPEIQAYFIYADEKGNNQTFCTPKLKQWIQE